MMLENPIESFTTQIGTKVSLFGSPELNSAFVLQTPRKGRTLRNFENYAFEFFFRAYCIYSLLKSRKKNIFQNDVYFLLESKIFPSQVWTTFNLRDLFKSFHPSAAEEITSRIAQISSARRAKLFNNRRSSP